MFYFAGFSLLKLQNLRAETMSMLNYLFELDVPEKKEDEDVNQEIEDEEELEELKKLNNKEIVGGKFVNNNANSECQLMKDRKLQSDPLFSLKMEQIHQRNKILLNEYKMKKIKEAVKAENKRKHRKRKKRERRERDKKLKEMLIESLERTQSRSKSPRPRSREHRHHHHHHHRRRRRRRHRSRSHSHSRSRSRSRSKSPKNGQRRSPQKFGLILNSKKVCGVKVDIKGRDGPSDGGKEEHGRRAQREEESEHDEQALLRKMMETADDYDEHRKHRVERRDRRRKYEEEDQPQQNRDGRYLREMGSKLYSDHSDSLQSRLRKNRSSLLKPNQL